MCIAELVAGALMGLIDWRAAFILPGAVSVAIGLWFAAMFRTGIRKAAVAGDTGRPAGGLGDFVRIMIVIGVITVLSGMVFQALTLGLPQLLDHRVEFPQGGGHGVGFAHPALLRTGRAAHLGGRLTARRTPQTGAY